MTRPSTPLSNNSKVPGYERQLYDNLNKIYNELLNLKNNRQKYINLNQIYQIYNTFLDNLIELKLTRKDEELRGITLVSSSTDSLIDDIWQLLSLCFVTCGLTKFAPATYSLLSAVHKLMDHLKECQVYTLQDLEPIHARLVEIKSIIDNNEDNDSEANDSIDDVLIKQAYLKFTKQSNIYKQEESLLLRNKLSKIEKLYQVLQNNFKNIPPNLHYNYNQLVTLRKNLINLITNNDSINLLIIDQFKAQIKSLKNYEKSPINNQELNYNSILDGLVDDVNNLLKDLIMKNNNNDDLLEFDQDVPEFKFIKQLDVLYNQLIDLRFKLENLLITRRWTMRETDLYTYQKLLKNIDENRKKINNEINQEKEKQEKQGKQTFEKEKSSQDNNDTESNNNNNNNNNNSKNKTDNSNQSKLENSHKIIYNVLDSNGKSIELVNKNMVNLSLSTNSSTSSLNTLSKTTTNCQQYLKKQQILILYLLRRCYSLIYKLLESSEPVSESLAPIFNQLSTVKRCLLELKRVDGINNIRELFPFQMKLASLDNLRVDGKFLINGQIPEGQGTLNALLSECFDIIHEIKIEMEDEDEDLIENHNPTSNFTITQTNDDTEVDIKRSRFKEFNAADYDLDSESAFDEEDDELESEEEEDDEDIQANDYY